MAGSWKSLTNAAPGAIATTLLLTDGTVIAQSVSEKHWYRLKPDASGSYVKGTWSALADSTNGPLYYASAILRDGRVIVAGGEYNFGKLVWLNAVEIYDPVGDKWQIGPTPAGWVKIGDAPGCVLPDGRFFLGEVGSNKTAIFDPDTNRWTAAANKLWAVGEESWSLLPDGTVHAVDCSNPPEAEKYLISEDRWLRAGRTPQVLVDSISEIGASVLLPDGRLFVIGATGFTAIYTMPSVASQPGTWVQGPVIPPVGSSGALGAVDAPAVVLPNGRVLFTAGPITTPASFKKPTYCFEFDPETNVISAVPRPVASGSFPYWGRFLMLPTGQALFTNGVVDAEVYTPAGAPDDAWRPAITSCPPKLQRGGTHRLFGRQLNGLTQCVYYGNDATQATNYPIIRLEALSGSAVYYCRTFGFSTMGVQTGAVVHHCDFVVPSSVPLGSYRLIVVANGIPSSPFAVTVSIAPAGQAWAKGDVEKLSALEAELSALQQHHPAPVDPKLLHEDPNRFRLMHESWLVEMQQWMAQVESVQARLSQTFAASEVRAAARFEVAAAQAVIPQKITAAEARIAAHKTAYNDGTPEKTVSAAAAKFSKVIHGLSRSGGKPLRARPPKKGRKTEDE